MEEIIYGFHESELGRMLIAEEDGGICWISFLTKGQSQSDSLVKFKHKFRDQPLFQSDVVADNMGRNVIRSWKNNVENELSLCMKGTDFQISVWKALMDIGKGYVCSYSEVAEMINRNNAVRAVASAIAANPIALVIPCHRVIQKGGGLGDYAWGRDLKKRILLEEGVPEDIIK